MRSLTDAARLGAFMKALGRAAAGEAVVYLTGGATAVIHGWRDATIDADIKIIPEREDLLRAIPAIKEDLKINVEFASPDHFLPPLPGWEERSPFISREGTVTFRHYDYYAQALSKIERGHAQDAADVREMKVRKLIEPAKLVDLFLKIEPELFRYPAVDPGSLRRAVEEFAGSV